MIDNVTYSRGPTLKLPLHLLINLNLRAFCKGKIKSE